MPPIRKKITPEEQRIARAIKALKDGEYTTVAKAHRAYNVPYQKLLLRHQGRLSTNSLGGHNKALNDAQEQALLQYIDRCDELGRPCKHKHIELAANSLLRASGNSNTVSRAWTSRFIKRHKVVRHRLKPLSAARKAAQKQSDIDLHFELFQKRWRELSMVPKNLHNFDKSGFRIGCLAGQIVFTRTDKQVYISDPDNRELVTSMESIDAEGGTTNPMLIMPGQ